MSIAKLLARPLAPARIVDSRSSRLAVTHLSKAKMSVADTALDRRVNEFTATRRLSRIMLGPGVPFGSDRRSDLAGGRVLVSIQRLPDHIVRCYRHDEAARLDDDTDQFDRFQGEVERILGAGVKTRAVPST